MSASGTSLFSFLSYCSLTSDFFSIWRFSSVFGEAEGVDFRSAEILDKQKHEHHFPIC